MSMRLPCVLLIEPDMPEGVSARKLVLETAKINVISAYTAESGLDNLEAFPNVDAVILHVNMRDLVTKEIMQRVRHMNPNMKFILVAPQPESFTPSQNLAVVDAFDPTSLLFVAQRWLQPDLDVFEEAGD
ncbi:MAG: hypothetical protein JOZ43_06990 [Acidobacteriales bacterium]|nr:hypothetical protein [Terriglobales bacterium]